MSKLYAFAFSRRNISSSTLYNLNNLDNRYLLFGKVSIDKYCEKLLKDQPEYILGMGIYTGRDQTHLRIETRCSNKFRREYINSNSLIELEIKPFVDPSEDIILAQSIGNSWCNLISYKILSLIKAHKLNSNYTFIHLPKKMGVEYISELLNNQLKSI